MSEVCALERSVLLTAGSRSDVPQPVRAAEPIYTPGRRSECKARRVWTSPHMSGVQIVGGLCSHVPRPRESGTDEHQGATWAPTEQSTSARSLTRMGGYNS